MTSLQGRMEQTLVSYCLKQSGIMDTTHLSKDVSKVPSPSLSPGTRHEVLKLQKSEAKFHTLLNQQVLSELLETSCSSMNFGAQMDICLTV